MSTLFSLVFHHHHHPGVPYNGNRMGVPMDKYMTQLHTMTGRVKDAAWSPDSRFVLTASSNGRLQYGLLDVVG